MAQTIPPRYSPAELIAELREAAEEIAPELNGIRPEETLEGESAQTLEEMQEALRRIAAGAPNPQEVARAALSAKAPLRPFGKPRNTVVKMPKPKPNPSKSDASRPNASKSNVSKSNVSKPKFPPKR